MTQKGLVPAGDCLPAAPSAASATQLLSLALEKGASVDVMERLLAMKEKIDAKIAKELFDSAMSNFQAACPTIHKDKKVLNKDGRSVRYRYAPLDSIIAQVKTPLRDHGFSYSVTAEITPENWVLATCKATHSAGHSETSSFKVPIDKDAYMNEQQKVAAALTYAKRYAFCNCFGILTGDEDDDANSASEGKTPDQTKQESAKKTTPEPATLGENVVSGFVAEVLQRPTKTPGSNKYTILIGEEKYFTFSSTDAKIAKEAKEDGKPVKIRFKVSSFGKDIETITTEV